MPDDSLVLDARHLGKCFGHTCAVDDVSFGVERGECFGLLGPNGAGKTTVLRMTYCASPRTSGTLNVFGLDPDKHPAEIKHRLGVVPQTDNLDDEVSVVKNLEIYAGYFGLSRAGVQPRIRELLAFMSLEGREQDEIRELSGGLKRRLVVARALLNDPEMVILDEPTTGLDPQVRHLIWAKLRELKARGVTLLLTTHYMEEAHQLCDRLLVMDHGRILAHGRPRALVASRLPGHVLELPSDAAPGRLPAGASCEVHGDVAYVYSASPEALERLAATTTSGDYRIRSTTLEDLFLKLTGRDLRESE
jgi:lipooligosaccharide transport system ATP-binding protein